MVSTDPIADMLSRIRNAISAHKNRIELPHSKMKATILEELKKNQYIDSFSVGENELGFKVLNVVIHAEGTNARINHIKRISTPGRRIYAKVSDIPKVKNGRGIVILSTPKGIMTGYDARSAKLGGEVICEVY